MDTVLDTFGIDEFVDVDSAFMMLAIYKIDKIRGCQYSGVGVNGEMDCEHVAFHRCMLETHNASIKIAMWSHCSAS